jgi:proteic killer suppression protein
MMNSSRIYLSTPLGLDRACLSKSAGLQKLSGDRKGQWAMIINGPWPLCFRFEDGHAWDVEIVDYH